MEILITEALTEAVIKLNKITPELKMKTKSTDIDDISPLEVVSFMRENDIPDDARFHCHCDCGLRSNGVSLVWEIEVPTTASDKLKYKRQKFTQVAWVFVYNAFIKNGYKRVGFNTGQLKEFKDTSIYDMYMSRDFDRLVKYYSLSFIPMEGT
jgi:hypothetical protein